MMGPIQRGQFQMEDVGKITQVQYPRLATAMYSAQPSATSESN